MKMKKHTAVILMILAGLMLVFASESGQKSVDIKNIKCLTEFDGQGVKPDIDFGKIPLYFIFNKGQVNKKARFYAKASRYTLWLTRGGLVFDSIKTHSAESTAQSKKLKTALNNNRPAHSSEKARDVSRLLFISANKNPEMVPIDEAKLRVNYFIGNDKSKWHCDVPTSKAVLYKNLYKSIDLKVYGLEKQIEYDWIVKPTGSPGNISFEYTNVKGTRIDKEGNLLIETDFGELMHKKPVSYQEIGRERKDVDVTFKQIAENTYGFEVGAYDRSRELIIDPVVLAYSTYLGGGGGDIVTGIAVDAGGNVYVTGGTNSTDFPTLDQYQGDQGDRDVFVTRLDTTRSGASSLIYSTYLGGGGDDYGRGIAVDAGGNAYVTGWTGSTAFPTLNQYQTYQGGGFYGYDVFVTRLDTTRSGASSLIYSTYLGGGGDDWGQDIAIDAGGNAYMTGETRSTDFPTLNQYQTYQGDVDVFVTRLDTNQSGASGLLYSTYLGGGFSNTAYGIAADTGGNAYVTGFTEDGDFPTLNQYQAYQGIYDAFVTRLDTTQSGASSLIYSTFLGGGDFDIGYDIAVDGSGNAYVVGGTSSTDFPTLNQYQAYQGDADVFVTRLDTNQSGASSLIYSTYLGGGSADRGYDIAVDAGGNAYVTGSTYSTDFPTLNRYQTYQGSGDVFVTMLDTNQSGASGLLYSTYMGGEATDSGNGIAVDAGGNAYVTGWTDSTTFPALNQYQTYQGGNDVFVTKISNSSPTVPTITTTAVSDITTTTVSSGGNVTSGGGAAITARGVCWSTSTNPTTADSHTTDGSGTGTFTSSITGLTPNTTYYVRAYATNGEGTAYGNEVTFTTSESLQIELNRTRLNFGAIIGEAQTGSLDFLIGKSGGGDLNWTASASDTWIQVSPSSGTAAGLVTVSVDPTGLTVGTYNGTVSIADASASNSPRTVSVILNIYSPGTADIPFGEFSTPVDGSTLRSSIPVTGWVLDDIEVSSVKIYRDGNVYIGDAEFVEGARPDVEGKYPAYPYNYRAGWGYMMLTNFLPNQGNGTFLIIAVATDSSGNEVILGYKTITCDNANAVKPFGAIDTPTQGGDASGSNFVNFGWALTPRPNTIPTDGSTIKVWVDGVPLAGNPVYNKYRSDISTLFPGYNNSGGAAGLYYLDTTLYANGTHTIAWSVTDDAGNTDGIGSRYFRVLNVGNSLAGSASPPGYGHEFSIQNLPAAISPVYLKKGYKTGVKGERQTETIYPDKEGIINMEIKEIERVEIEVGIHCRGYILVDGQLRGLPVGSAMDMEKGVFYWQPGPGFIGEYRFVFVKRRLNGQMNRRKINITISPKH